MKKIIVSVFVSVFWSTFIQAAYIATQEQVRHPKGLKRSPGIFYQFLSSRPKHAMPPGTVPGTFDLTPIAAPPLDQGNCGSCWAFSITKAFWSEFLINGVNMAQPAINYLLNNCSGVRAAREAGCNGGDFPAGLAMIPRARGPWSENMDPYEQKSGFCKGQFPRLGTAVEWTSIGDGITAPTFQELADANYNNGKGHVLSIDVAAGSGNWENYSSGIYDGTGTGIDHMIDLVGYNCETSVDANGNCSFNQNGIPVNGDGYLKVENNWGTTWGEAGYMRTRWGANQVAQTAMYFTIQ